MKAIYLTIITFLFLFGSALFPNQANAVVCQNKTAVVYSNGMFNDRNEANRSRQRLDDELHIKLAGTPLLAELEMNHLAYATNGGATNPLSLSGLEQLLEVGRQAFGDKSTDLFWLAISRGVGKIADKTLPQPAADLINQIIPSAPPPVFRKAMQNISLTIDEAAFMNDPDFNKMMNGGNGFDGYQTLLGSGKRVVIVSHSQGNFYANRVYRTLADPAYGGNAALAVSIGVVAVATPANVSPGGKVGLNEPNITVPEDYVIAPVRASLGSLASKPDTTLIPQWSPNMAELRLGAWVDATIGHSFVDWYLAGTYTRDFIMKGITDTINGVNGVGGLQYPKKCIQWPPVQTPTSWQKVLTHEWNTNRAIYTAFRRMRDDVNKVMYSAAANDDRWTPTGWDVTLFAKSFDGSSFGRITFNSLSYVSNGASFLGFIPIPNGVGTLWSEWHALPLPVVPSGTYVMSIYERWNTSVTLVSHTWDNITSTWKGSVNTQSLPTFPMMYDYCAPSGSRFGPPCAPGTYVAQYEDVSAYNVQGYKARVIQSAPYQSWVMFSGRFIPDESPTSPPGTWALVTVENGQLTVSGGQGYVYPGPSLYVRPIPAYEVGVPAGSYTPIHSAFAQAPLTLMSAWPECGIGCGETFAKPMPAVSSTSEGGFDQLIVGGSDLYISGQGLSSAPGYYEHRVFAAQVNGIVYNKDGVPSLVKKVKGTAQPIASTADDLLFFAW